MSPQHHEHTEHTDYPTSPWTEAYQTAPQWSDEVAANVSSENNASVTQEPTQHALFDIYNRGY